MITIRCVFLVLVLCLSGRAASPPGISTLDRNGTLVVTNAFTNGVCIVERAGAIEGEWRAAINVFSTSSTAQAFVSMTGAMSFFRAQALDLSGGRPGFTNLTRAFGVLTTIAGAGGPQEVN